jgi:hypothetical protein
MQRYTDFSILLTLYPNVETFASIKLLVPATSSGLAMAITKHTSSASAKQTASAIAVEPYRLYNTFFSAANG